jgi:geranylgeranyl pyrophosphate synthase
MSKRYPKCLKNKEINWDHLFTNTVLENGVLEYIDPEEQETLMISFWLKDIQSEYEKMMIYKTGYAFLINLELLMEKSTNIVFKKNYDKMNKILVLFSLFFQIRDDYINLTDLDYWMSKGFCQDFDEEKISYLITYFKTMSNIDIMEMMKDKSKEGKIKILLLFHETGLLDIIFDKLVELKQNITNEMELDFIFKQLPFHKFNINDVYNI